MIFSGKESKPLWNDIHKIRGNPDGTKKQKRRWRIHIALYNLGCHCQELECEVEKLKLEIASLKEKAHTH